MPDRPFEYDCALAHRVGDGIQSGLRVVATQGSEVQGTEGAPNVRLATGPGRGQQPASKTVRFAEGRAEIGDDALLYPPVSWSLFRKAGGAGKIGRREGRSR